MRACELRPEDKKALVSDVGRELVRRHGKQKYYPPADVGSAASFLGYADDIHCWAYCIFSSPSAFAELHKTAGEACDYAAMKAEVLTDLASASGGVFDGLDLDLSWLEWPDLDLSSLFDGFDLS